MAIKVSLNLGPFVDLSAMIRKGLASKDRANPIRRAFRTCAIIYRSFIQERFDSASKGDGTWKPLAASTIARRRAAKIAKIAGLRGAAKAAHEKRQARLKDTGGGAAILRDTGMLFQALSPTFSGAPGAIEEDIPNGIRVGFGGPSAHKGTSATVADIATFHDEGGSGGRPPQRKIIVPPTAVVIDRMGTMFEAALKRAVIDTKADRK